MVIVGAVLAYGTNSTICRKTLIAPVGSLALAKEFDSD
jgi:hypothetical protein